MVLPNTGGVEELQTVQVATKYRCIRRQSSQLCGLQGNATCQKGFNNLYYSNGIPLLYALVCRRFLTRLHSKCPFPIKFIQKPHKRYNKELWCACLYPNEWTVLITIGFGINVLPRNIFYPIRLWIVLIGNKTDYNKTLVPFSGVCSDMVVLTNLIMVYIRIR